MPKVIKTFNPFSLLSEDESVPPRQFPGAEFITRMYQRRTDASNFSATNIAALERLETARAVLIDPENWNANLIRWYSRKSQSPIQRSCSGAPIARLKECDNGMLGSPAIIDNIWHVDLLERT